MKLFFVELRGKGRRRAFYKGRGRDKACVLRLGDYATEEVVEGRSDQKTKKASRI